MNRPLLLAAVLLAATSLRAETPAALAPTPAPAPTAATPAPDVFANWKVIVAWAMDSALPARLGTAGAPGFIVPEKNGRDALELVKGVTVEEVPGAPTGKALVFDGTQIAAANSAGAIDLRTSAEFSFSFRPASTGTPRQTLIKTNGIYEIRLVSKETRAEFIITLPNKKYLLLHAPYKPDAWNTYRARLKDGQLSLKVNDAEATGALPPDVPLENLSNRVLLGFFGERIYTGAMANLVIRVP
jgi:hypothetical protein